MSHEAECPSPHTTRAPQSSLLVLPDAPTELLGPVKVWEQPVEILTYEPAKPDSNPMFLEKRVYQGSSGRVYPLPFIDRIATEPEKRSWKALHIENEFLRFMILPEIGGRIHIGYDKTNGYDFFYRQNVIKPALVGLAGPWISGGVEFNWPQHHRPATFMPVSTEIEYGEDGSVTVWCSDHDPMLRMKGMHGICLRPGRAVLELRVRLYNRTQFTQTFLWWANVATRVHEKYQSFFPTDVRFVADHAKRALTAFPQSDGVYYGIDYADRARNGVAAEDLPSAFVPDGSYPANDLSWYANIPVPTSYMVTGTKEDFFGGYDHAAKVGVVHVANHHVAPGKKQWTWGNHEFGYAWDRSLTDSDGPYIELMAGVYTDNQPDFSFLAPWETKTFTQTWYPIRAIGVPQASNIDAALSVRRVDDISLCVGLYVTRDIGDVQVIIRVGADELYHSEAHVDVANPLLLSLDLPSETAGLPISATILCAGGVLIKYDESVVVPAKAPTVAVEPPPPAEVASIEELYLAGLHLYQYRHATRLPELYWAEALKRDPDDSRSNNALGLWHLRRGEFAEAKEHFIRSIARLTRLNPNPYDGEPYYNLGLCERLQGNDELAYDVLYKATWNAAWRAPAYFALAEIDATRRDWQKALDHVKRSLAADSDNLAARNLLVLTLTELGLVNDAEEEHQNIRQLDPLDLASRYRDGVLPANGQEFLDLAFDLLRIGRREESVKLLKAIPRSTQDGSLPIARLLLAQVETDLKMLGASETFAEANQSSLEYCFPARLEEYIILQSATKADPTQPGPFYLLGNWLYDRRRYQDAIEAWEKAVLLDPVNAVAWRNLGIARFNVLRDEQGATEAFDLALRANPLDGRLLYERDQLWKRMGVKPQRRLEELRKHKHLVDRRDDLSVELATLYNQLGQPANALQVLTHRQFQPWEGGEGLVLGQYIRAHLQSGRLSLAAGAFEDALSHFQATLTPPLNLSEARHLLANQSDIFYWIGRAHEALGQREDAAACWHRATRQRGDFQQMAVRTISEMTYWTGMSLLASGNVSEAARLFQQIYDFSLDLERTEPKIDYFATSLPAMLLFEEDLVRRNTTEAKFLRAQALAGLDRVSESAALLQEVLMLDSNHAGAADLVGQLSAEHAETR